jgi:hypothetical protein
MVVRRIWRLDMDDQEKRDKFLAKVQDILAGVLIFAMVFGIMIVW